MESPLQFLLQSGVILFKLFSSEPYKVDQIDIEDHTMEVLSITTSFLTIIFGFSAFKTNMIQKEPKFLHKLKLAIRSTVDVIPR